MKNQKWIYPTICASLLFSAMFACDLPVQIDNTNSAATQTMEALATIVASTLDSLQFELTPSPTMLEVTELPPPTDTPELGQIVGLVWQDFNEDGVLDPGEPPMPGTAILLGEGPCDSVGYRSINTEDDGSFTFEDLPAGDYCVVVFLPHGCGGFSPTVEHPRTVTVIPGVDLGGLLLGVLENPC